MRRLFWITIGVLTIIVPVYAGPIDVWLDVDPAIGMIEKDVDDGLAMIQAFHSPELRVHGISVVFGNSPLDRGIDIAEEVATRFGAPGLSVYPGAASAKDFGNDSPAVAAMVSGLEQRPMTILALGPLTNVGTLLKNHPEVHERIAQIIMVAARRPGQVFRPLPESENVFPDFNFENDPASMQAILDSKVPLVYAPWEVSSHLWITNEDLDALGATGAPGEYIAKKSGSWIRMWKRMFGTEGFNPFDTLAVAWLTHPELIEHVEVGTWIDPREGSTGVDGQPPVPHLLADPDRAGGRRAIYCYRPRPELKRILLDRLAGPAAK